MPSATAVCGLFRSILKNSNQLTNYNFREHAKRRTIAEFRRNKGISPDLALQKFNYGLQQLEMVKRQALLSQLYRDVEEEQDGESKMHE